MSVWYGNIYLIMIQRILLYCFEQILTNMKSSSSDEFLIFFETQILGGDIATGHNWRSVPINIGVYTFAKGFFEFLSAFGFVGDILEDGGDAFVHFTKIF